MIHRPQTSPKVLFADFDWNLMGFGLCRAWITLLFSLSVPALLASGTSSRLWLLLPGAAFCLLLLPAPKFLASRQIRTLALVLSGAFAAIGLLGAYGGITNDLTALAIASMATLSISAALMQVLWSEKVSLLPERAIDFYTISAMLLAAILGALLQVIAGQPARWVCLTILPIGSWILLHKGFTAGQWERPSTADIAANATANTSTPTIANAGMWGSPATIDDETQADQATAPSLPLGRFCVSIFVFVVVFNAISPVFSTVENPISVRTPANLVITLGLFVLFLQRGSVNLTSLYPLSFIVLLGAVLSMLFVPPNFLYLSMFFAAAGYKLFDILFWCLLITMAHHLGSKKWRILGLGMAANFGGMGLGSALGSLPSFLQTTNTLSDAFIISSFVFILAITIVVILPERLLVQLTPTRQQKQTNLTAPTSTVISAASETSFASPSSSSASSAPSSAIPPAPAAQSLETRCEEVAQQQQLTRREREVFLLLAQGRTQSVIAKKLGISEGTVHTHILHVYQKLDVHSQQELIELLN